MPSLFRLLIELFDMGTLCNFGALDECRNECDRSGVVELGDAIVVWRVDPDSDVVRVLMFKVGPILLSLHSLHIPKLLFFLNIERTRRRSEIVVELLCISVSSDTSFNLHPSFISECGVVLLLFLPILPLL